jgi:predicted nucleic acid-binding protein
VFDKGSGDQGRGHLAHTIDCFIAWTAIENNLFLLHNDKDFEKIATVTELQIY